MSEIIVVTIVTIGAILLNCVTAVRALALAMAFESGCNWVCRTVGHENIMRVLYSVATVSFILVILKTWSIFDVFIGYWDSMNDIYHLRAFAYLGENYGVGMVGYAITSLIKRMAGCTTSEEYRLLKKRLKKYETNKISSGTAS